MRNSGGCSAGSRLHRRASHPCWGAAARCQASFQQVHRPERNGRHGARCPRCTRGRVEGWAHGRSSSSPAYQNLARPDQHAACDAKAVVRLRTLKAGARCTTALKMDRLDCLQTLEGHEDRVWSAAWSPDGKCSCTTPAVTSRCGDPCLLNSFQCPQVLHMCAGEALASCSGDKTVRIWTQKRNGVWFCSGILDGTHHRTIRSCSWSPNGRYLATAGFDAVVAIWEHQVDFG